jgi:hypothetical protein
MTWAGVALGRRGPDTVSRVSLSELAADRAMPWLRTPSAPPVR